MHMIGQYQMAEDHRAPADRAVRTDGRAAGNSCTASQSGVFANTDVVPDLNKIVEFDAVFDQRIVERAPVDAGVGANFDVVSDPHRSQLFDLFPSTIVGRKAESIRADDHSGVQDATLTNRAVSA